jgi:hypothetical protein
MCGSFGIGRYLDLVPGNGKRKALFLPYLQAELDRFLDVLQSLCNPFSPELTQADLERHSH